MNITDRTMSEPLKFIHLNSIVSLFTPPSSAINTNGDIGSSNPTTIIVCQWNGAHPKSRFLASIYAKYHVLYPNARILSIRSLPEFFVTTSTSARLKLFPLVVSALQEDTDRRVLVHLFSNGGAQTLVDLCHLWKEQAGAVLPVKAIVLDSAPGNPGAKEAWAAMAVGLPKGLLWYPAAAVLSLVVVGFWVQKSVFGMSNMVEETRRDLNDGALVDLGARRLYIYSEADKLVGFRDVERHAEEARAKGVQVKMQRGGASAHVQHMGKVSDPSWEVYWKSVLENWG
jgi:hypothetical protein